MIQSDVRLVQAPLPPAAPAAFPADCGAECLFIGRTRCEVHPIHGELRRLEYVAYEPMALAIMHALSEDAVHRFECRTVRLVHALGAVAVGEASVIVQVAAGHRAAAFEACRFLIDELKARAPIWKREVWADGTTWSDAAPVPVSAEAGP